MRAGAHTPGNWTIDHERIGPPGEPVALLCDMTAPHGATVVDWPRGDGEAVDDAENEANARLLAAAPALLEAAQEALGCLELRRDPDGDTEESLGVIGAQEWLAEAVAAAMGDEESIAAIAHRATAESELAAMIREIRSQSEETPTT